MPPANQCAVFVHAGAGFHSYEAEADHLRACSAASQIAMAILKTGGTAVDAVEAAIKNLEDNEVTNAGYGSNLTLHGTVECDATIVDHLGRCGAVGAVENVRNPISLARVILDQSVRPLSLNRVPPNFLVGTGATEFAYEHGIPIMPSDFLVAPASKERFEKWSHDLKAAEAAERSEAAKIAAAGFEHTTSVRNHSQWAGCPPPAAMASQQQTYQASGVFVDQTGHVRNYYSSANASGQNARISGQRQPSDIHFITDGGHPTGGDGARSVKESNCTCTCGATRTLLSTGQPVAGNAAHVITARQAESDHERSQTPPAASLSAANLSFFNSNSEVGCVDDSIQWPYLLDGAAGDKCACQRRAVSTPERVRPLGANACQQSRQQQRRHMQKPPFKPNPRQDDITDTVGAIAIDMYGNVAAGSSSGGIGMKHPGRVGPAALVGIGTSIIPIDSEDEEGRCVAVAVSGTGEHMSTTMIAKTCGERIYDGVKKVRGSGTGLLWTVEQCTEDEALASVIQDEFMGHPGVKGNGCPAAIGMMCVKMTRNGIGFYFAHNTDSFAIASMNATDRAPQVLLSRTDGDKAKIAQGGRLLSFRHKNARRTKAAETVDTQATPAAANRRAPATAHSRTH